MMLAGLVLMLQWCCWAREQVKAGADGGRHSAKSVIARQVQPHFVLHVPQLSWSAQPRQHASKHPLPLSLSLHAVSVMTDTTEGAPAPKKRSLFKRAAWQDAPKKEEEDMFSHSSEFKNIIAEQSKREEEKRRKATEERRRRQDGQVDRKRRKVSGDHDEPALPRSGSGNSSSGRATRTNTKA
jgi:hypothetical protein